MLAVEATPLADVIVIQPERYRDHRGYFSELFNSRRFSEIVGHPVDFVQDNESMSHATGTLRGLHYQLPPHAQGKLVRAVQGSLLDVAVDIRTSSPTYGHHVAVELDARSGRQLWIPPGMAHGFCTLEPDTVIGYKVTSFYAPRSDRSLNWADPGLAIDWPFDGAALTLSNKDADAPYLSELERSGCVFA